MILSPNINGEVRVLRSGIWSSSPEISQFTVKPQADAGARIKIKQTTPLTAFIGAGVQCKGVMNSEGEMHIEGCLEGEIHTKGTLRVGEQAVLKAQIQAGSVISKGQISGSIVARREVRLLSSAVVTGPVSTPHLSVEKGAKLDSLPPVTPMSN